MDTPAPPAEPTRPADPAELDLCRDAIRAILAAGTKLVEQLAADPDTQPGDKAEPFERMARAIRRTILLARHLADRPREPTPNPAAQRAQARRTVLREVETAIETRAETPEHVESLRAELHEVIEEPQFEADLASLPLSEIIADIKRDLGLETSYGKRFPRRTPTEIRALNARAAAHTKRAPTAPDDQTNPDDTSPHDPDFDLDHPVPIQTFRARLLVPPDG